MLLKKNCNFLVVLPRKVSNHGNYQLKQLVPIIFSFKKIRLKIFADKDSEKLANDECMNIIN